MLVHDQHDNISVRPANLETKASAFQTHRCWRAPSRMMPAAHDVSLSILSADYESSLLHARYNRNTIRFTQQILRDTLIGRVHNFV